MMPIGVFAFRGMHTRSWMRFWMSAARPVIDARIANLRAFV